MSSIVRLSKVSEEIQYMCVGYLVAACNQSLREHYRMLTHILKELAW